MKWIIIMHIQLESSPMHCKFCVLVYRILYLNINCIGVISVWKLPKQFLLFALIFAVLADIFQRLVKLAKETQLLLPNCCDLQTDRKGTSLGLLAGLGSLKRDLVNEKFASFKGTSFEMLNWSLAFFMCLMSGW